MKSTQKEITKDEFAPILAKSLYHFGLFLDKNPEYSVEVAKEKNADKVCYIKNESYVIMRYTQQKNMKMKDNKGTIRNYIWDEKDKIYKSKKKDRIVLPNICCVIETEECAEYYKKMGIFGEGDKHFHTSALNSRAENHTGNHYRNNFVKVPPKSIGR